MAWSGSTTLGLSWLSWSASWLPGGCSSPSDSSRGQADVREVGSCVNSRFFGLWPEVWGDVTGVHTGWIAVAVCHVTRVESRSTCLARACTCALNCRRTVPLTVCTGVGLLYNIHRGAYMPCCEVPVEEIREHRERERARAFGERARRLCAERELKRRWCRLRDVISERGAAHTWAVASAKQRDQRGSTR